MFYTVPGTTVSFIINISYANGRNTGRQCSKYKNNKKNKHTKTYDTIIKHTRRKMTGKNISV